jgi:chromosome segregation ATPase
MDKMLNQLDKILEQKNPDEVKAYFFLPILIFGFISYYFIYPITDQKLEEATQQYNTLSEQISSTETDNNSLKGQINKIKRDIKVVNKDIAGLVADLNRSTGWVSEIQNLQFDFIRWISFYNDIPNIAKENHLKIVSITNSLYEDLVKKKTQKRRNNKRKSKNNKNKKTTKAVVLPKVEPKNVLVKELSSFLVVEGDFKDIVKFIYYLENRKSLLKVKKINIVPLGINRRVLKLEITFDVYGVKL